LSNARVGNPTFDGPRFGYVVVMKETTDLSEQPVAFDAESSKSAHLASSAFRGRVPVVLVFVGVPGSQSDTVITGLDRALIRFGERRVQLLVVVDANPSEVAARLKVTVPLISDAGLAEELNAQMDDQGRISSVILGNDGRILDVVRQLPTADQSSAVLVALERLTAEFPDRLGTLPEPDQNVEAIDDPTGARAKGDAPSFRQRLGWFTGDRAMEARALADTVADKADAPTAGGGNVLAAAEKAVSEAHGDSSVEEDDPVTSDMATREDVIEKL